MLKAEFPIFKTRIEDLTKKFDLNDPKERKEYFKAKVGPEIEKLQEYLTSNTFVGFLIGKKNSGKGTYSKLFMEAVSRERIGHVAVGDIVRDVHKNLDSERTKAELINFLEKNYRGFHSINQTIDLIEGRNQETLMSSELIVALLKYEISRRPKQAIFIDGFPRALDQIGYSLFLRELIGYREDPDFMIFIDVPDAVIDERIKYRVVCPVCKTPRSIKLLATKEVEYDKKQKTFYLICDNPSHKRTRMIAKEGDELGIEPIRGRLEIDNQIFNQLLSLTGIPKIFLRNSLPKDKALEYVDDYELTPEYSFELDAKTGKVKIIEKHWTVKDDNGVESHSLLPPAVVVSMIKQVAQALGL